MFKIVSDSSKSLDYSIAKEKEDESEVAVVSNRTNFELISQIAFVCLIVACVSAKPQFIAAPGVAPVAYSAPFVAAPAAAYATSAVVSREYHGNSLPYVAAAYSAPFVAAPAAYASPFAAAYSAPIYGR